MHLDQLFTGLRDTYPSICEIVILTMNPTSRWSGATLHEEIVLDLRSANNRASWHPLTSLIEFQGAWEDRHFCGLPMISEPNRVDGRSPITTIHHELSHLAAARTTRFGFALSSEAGRVMKAFRKGDSLDLSNPIENLLAGFLAPLEGLALYAELDSDEAKEDLLLPHPVSVHAQMMSVIQGRSERHVYYYAREEQIFEPSEGLIKRYGERGGLLRALFADTIRPDLSFYFVGYLWVKAAVASIEHFAPRLARPSTALPLLTRLICDHPIIDKIWRGEASHKAVPAALCETIAKLDAQSLSRLQNALEVEEIRDQFDHLDLHSFLENRVQTVPSIIDEKSLTPFFEDLEDDKIDPLLESIRASASMHFMTRTSGTLSKVEFSASGYNFHVNDTRGTTTCHVPDLLDFWTKMYSAVGRSVPSKARAFGSRYQQAIFAVLSKLEGKRISLSNYWLMSNPDVCGIAFWDPKGRPYDLPLTPEWFEDGDLVRYTRAAIRISPAERIELASSLPYKTNQVFLEREATSLFFKHLVANPRNRDRMERRRYLGVLSPEARADMLRWVAYPLSRQQEWELEPRTIDELDLIFDFPGFPALKSQELSQKLFPSFTQPSD